MDIGRAFKFMFDDESWITKILLGGILGLVPILNFVLYGYQLEHRARTCLYRNGERILVASS